jgi:predicted HTH transcriptional regulator
VFVSSVQKELEEHRLVLHNHVNTDAFLSAHCIPVLYELEPAAPEQALEGCLAALATCQVYVLIVGIQYGTPVGDLSITHAEYRRAKEMGLPILAFIQGDRSVKREAGTERLLKELDEDGFKYKRFQHIVDLQKEVRAALVKLLHIRFGVDPTSDEDAIAERTIEATSSFESQRLDRARWQDLDQGVARELIARASAVEPGALSGADVLAGATARGLVWLDRESGEHFATAAGIVLLARDPSVVFPQCRVLADAYRGTETDGDPRDHEDIRGPMSLVIDRAIAFVDRNTRHPMRVVGLNRVRLDEYPVEALREALVNASVHRLYEDGGRKIILEVFSDRIVIASPGLPPASVTLAGLRKGKYRPCSRNPVLAQCLSYFHRIEERGHGFRRMRDQMLDHGLDAPTIGADSGYFEVTFTGPGDKLARLRVPEGQLLVTPAVEARMNGRQKEILAHALQTGSVTTGWCMSSLVVARDTAHRDLVGLVKMGLLSRRGAGRGAAYVPREVTPK